MIHIQDVKDYWNSTELINIADYNQDNNIDDEVIQKSIDEANKAIEPINNIISANLKDNYLLKLTICNLLSRLNVNPDAIELPLQDCKEVKELISKILSAKAKAKGQEEADKISKSKGIQASLGKKGISNILDIM